MRSAHRAMDRLFAPRLEDDPVARSLGLVVITGNLGEFRRVAGLRSEDWLAPD